MIHYLSVMQYIRCLLIISVKWSIICQSLNTLCTLLSYLCQLCNTLFAFLCYLWDDPLFVSWQLCNTLCAFLCDLGDDPSFVSYATHDLRPYVLLVMLHYLSVMQYILCLYMFYLQLQSPSWGYMTPWRAESSPWSSMLTIFI